MSLHLLNLDSIKDLAPSVKAKLPVSITAQPDGSPLVVSRYADEVWDFYPYIPQENLSPANKCIDWRIQLFDGRRLTDVEHAGLLESAKDFIWSLFSQPVEGRKRPTMLTLRNKVRDIIPLLRWMVTMGLCRFAQLDGRLLEYVPIAKLNVKGGKLTDLGAVMRLFIVEDLYHQRDKINDALSVHPWPHESATSLVGVKGMDAYRKPKTEFIPDAIAGRLANAALDYIQNRSALILEIMEAVDSLEAQVVAGWSKKSICNDRTAVIRKAGYANVDDLHAEIARLRTACYIIIDMFSGIRDSEMMSIAENCVVAGKSLDASTDVLWLHGTIYKTGLRPKRWLVPSVVLEAVDVLTRLAAPLRTALMEEEQSLEARIGRTMATERVQLVKRLDTVRKHRNKLFLTQSHGRHGIAVLSGSAMRVHLKRFCSGLGIHGENGQPYPLHGHQFRRTYARFIARAELGDLLTLRDHFGHWAIDMTVFYADGGADEYEADAELLEMVSAEKLARQNEIIGGYLDSNAPLANGHHWLKDWRLSVRTASNKEALIAEYAGSITLNGTGHSWCVGNARGTGCGGLCVFEPQMCVDCSYGIIGPEHRPVWEGILAQQLEVLTLDDIGIAGMARAREVLAYAERVLRRLDGQEVVA